MRIDERLVVVLRSIYCLHRFSIVYLFVLGTCYTFADETL